MYSDRKVFKKEEGEKTTPDNPTKTTRGEIGPCLCKIEYTIIVEKKLTKHIS